MTKKFYLETFKKCPGSLCFQLLTFPLVTLNEEIDCGRKNGEPKDVSMQFTFEIAK